MDALLRSLFVQVSVRRGANLVVTPNMLVLTGGQERTEEEYARLFVGAGLRLTGVVPVAHPYGIFEGAPN